MESCILLLQVLPHLLLVKMPIGRRTVSRASFLFCLLILLSNSATYAQNNSLPFCNRVLNETLFELHPATAENEKLHYVIYPKKLPDGNCTISGNNSLRIGFEWNTKVSEILIDEVTLSANPTIENISASLCTGQCSPSTTVECKLLDTRRELKGVKKRRFVAYSCSHNSGIYGETGVHATSMELKSTSESDILNLKMLKDRGSLALLCEEMSGNSSGQAKGCQPPGLYDHQTLSPEKDYYSSTENVTIWCRMEHSEPWLHDRLTCQNGSWAYYTPSECKKIAATDDYSFTQEPSAFGEKNGEPSIRACEPIEPYSGMPENYNDYELIRKGSINELLRASPCRSGFALAKADVPYEINQCKDGVWQGDGFPRCEEKMKKPPPDVEHGSWIITNSENSEAVYSCDDGYRLANNSIGKATYNQETDEWIGVPKCQQEGPANPEEPSANLPLIIGFGAVAAIAAAVVAVAVGIVYYRKKCNRRPKDRNVHEVTYSAVVQREMVTDTQA